MKKPRKRIIKFWNIPTTNPEDITEEGEIEGWNDHYDAVEKWLPSEEEIRGNIERFTLSGNTSIRGCAYTISKRLRGEK